MEFKTIRTGGISYLDDIPGTESWYWGTDYVHGDLYEAEELYNDRHEISRNRMIFVSYPEGVVREPVKAKDGQYFGNCVFTEGRIFFLLVDFDMRKIFIYRCSDDCTSAEVFREIPLDEAKDCYNLMLGIEPLTLIRQGHENRFQVIWPDKGDFAIAPQESLDSREGDELVFSKWYEDPDYREETVIRRYPTGEVIETFEGNFRRMPDFKGWLLI